MSDIERLIQKVDGLVATLDVYALRTQSFATDLALLRDDTAQIIARMDKVEGLTTQVVDKIQPLLEQAGPMIDKLQNSPIVKMLG